MKQAQDHRQKNRLKFIIATPLVVLLVIAGIIAITLYSFTPDYDAELKVKGLHNKVVVERNRYAVPSIYAQNEEDLSFAWGYVNAQDRIFQMEINKRAGQGRLSEFAGEQTLKKDIFLRAVGFYDIAKKVTQDISPEMRNLLQRYVDGINYYLDTNPVPLYFRLAGIKKEKWTIVDPILVGMMLNWTMSYNMDYELMYYEIEKKIGPERCRELLRFTPRGAGTILEGKLTGAGLDNLTDLLTQMGNILGCGYASNNWVVSASKSAYKGAILANDPHVHYSRIPNDFYLIHVKTPDYEAAGAQVAGLPLLILGYNQYIAWGITNNNADIVDLFIEDVDKKNKTYLYKGKELPLRSKEETFFIKGKEPVKKTLYYAGRRPLLDDVFTDIDDVISIDWSGFDGMNAEGFHSLCKARNYSEFLNCMKELTIVPLNVVYADKMGNIAYQLIGRLPRREEGSGNLPGFGPAEDKGWDGYYPFEKNPRIINPQRGFIATANNKVTRTPLYLNGTYHPSYRYERIEEMLKHKDKVDVDYIKKMQMDTKTTLKDKVVAIANKYVISDKDKRIPEAMNILKHWNGVVGKDECAPSIYNTFLVRFMYNTFVDELGEDLAAKYVSHRQVSLDRFFELIDNNSSFFDNIKTAKKESISDIATYSFIETLNILRNFFGSDDMSTWKWGEIHKIEYNHILGKSRILRPFVNLTPLPYGGDCETIFNGRFLQIKPPYTPDLAPGVRMIVRFDEKPKGYFMQMTGENEYFLSKHYADMTEQLLKGKYFCMEDEKEMKYKMVFLPE